MIPTETEHHRALQRLLAEPRPCRVCGLIFRGGRWDKIFCSHTCATRSARGGQDFAYLAGFDDRARAAHLAQHRAVAAAIAELSELGRAVREYRARRRAHEALGEAQWQLGRDLVRDRLRSIGWEQFTLELEPNRADLIRTVVAELKCPESMATAIVDEVFDEAIARGGPTFIPAGGRKHEGRMRTPEETVLAINQLLPHIPPEAVREQLSPAAMAPTPPSAPPDKPDIYVAMDGLREHLHAAAPDAHFLISAKSSHAAQSGDDVTALFPDAVMRNIQGVGIVVVTAILDHLAAQGVLLPDAIDTITSEMVRVAINEIGSETMAALIQDLVLEILRSARRHDAERRSAAR